MRANRAKASPATARFARCGMRAAFVPGNSRLANLPCARSSTKRILLLTFNVIYYTISQSLQISAYVPRENRRPQDFKMGQQDNVASGTTDFDVDCEPLSEEFSVYDSSNGMVVSIKAVAGQINKTKFFTPDGEPAYAVDASPIMKVKRD